MLESTEKGGVRNSIQNCLTVFQHDPILSGAVAKNLLTERIDLLKPIGRKRRTGSKAMTDTDMKYIRLYLEKTYGLTSEKKIADAADLAADANSYHPIRDYLNGLVWDGKERIRYCLRHFLGADTDNYTFQSLRLFLLGAIHRAFCPGCKFEVMLCLVGGQGAGKSTFFRLLAVKDEWFSDDLRKLDDDNVYRKLQGHWIIEMSEMIATANAKSIQTLLHPVKQVFRNNNRNCIRHNDIPERQFANVPAVLQHSIHAAVGHIAAQHIADTLVVEEVYDLHHLIAVVIPLKGFQYQRSGQRVKMIELVIVDFIADGSRTAGTLPFQSVLSLTTDHLFGQLCGIVFCHTFQKGFHQNAL